MINYQENKILPFSAEDLFKLVSDIEDYPNFLPWCKGARIKSCMDNIIIAELLVRFGLFNSSYTSKVTLNPNKTITVLLEEGPLNRLTTFWQFEECSGIGTSVTIDVNFQFKTSIFQKAAELVFKETAQKMLRAFEERARIKCCSVLDVRES